MLYLMRRLTARDSAYCSLLTFQGSVVSTLNEIRWFVVKYTHTRRELFRSYRKLKTAESERRWEGISKASASQRSKIAEFSSAELSKFTAGFKRYEKSAKEGLGMRAFPHGDLLQMSC